ncbi:MAG: ABC transporter substrate-binding protein, partial [Chloroflexota bacterium]
EVLAELLWDDRSQRQALANLRVVLSTLRKEVGPFVEITRTTASIASRSELAIDVSELEAAAALMRGQDGEFSPDIGEKTSAALDAYEGDFLEGFFIADATGFEEWATRERERLHRLAVDALQRLGDWYLKQGEYGAAIAWATRTLEVDPLVEAGRRQLMEALARSGQRADAVAQYERCRELLHEELGLEPEAETQALYAAIREGRLASTGASLHIVSETLPVLPDFLTTSQPMAERTIPFLERKALLARLHRKLQAMQEGRTRAVFISGEAGSGKTALMREFARRATETAPELVIAAGHSSTVVPGESGYQAFRQILAQLAGDVEPALLSGVLTQEQARRLWALMPHTARAMIEHGPNLPGGFVNGRGLMGRLAAALPDCGGWLDELANIVEQGRAVSRELDQAVVHDQYAAVLRSLAKRSPLLLILEDLHWADAATLALLFHLGQQTTSAPLLLLGTYRPEEVQASRPLLEKIVAEFKRTYGAAVMDLDAISAGEGRAFIDGLLQAKQLELDERFRDALLTHTGGHPLFTIELLHALRERGDLQAVGDGGWQVGAEIEWAELPVRIEGVIEERIGRLQPLSRQILTAAAVEGETFTAQVIARALNLQESEVINRLSGVLERTHRLIQSLGTRRLGRQRLSRYRFSHALFRHYIYDDLREVQRSYLHEVVGNALEQLYRGETATIAARLAWHFGEAGLTDKSQRYSLLAGDQARLEYAFAEAARHYENAIAVLQEHDDPALAARTLMKLGLTYHIGRDYRQARHAFNKGFAAWLRTERRAGGDALAEAPHAFRQAAMMEPKTLNHLEITNILEVDIVRQLFTGLTESGDGGEVLPGVAARWEIAAGGCKYIFHLRHDARWSDGHPVTAADFVLALRQELDPRRAFYDSKLDDIKGATAYRQAEATAEQLGIMATDRHTLVIELERPSGRFLSEDIFPVPGHRVQRYGDVWAQPEHMVSNGPFKLVEWQPQERLVFERNPHYHGRYDGNVTRVELQISDSWTTALAAYERDELDILRSSDATSGAFQKARQHHLSDYISIPELKTVFLAFNMNHEPFRDRRVRHALTLAIDRERLANVALQGMLFPATGGMIPQGVAGYEPGINLPHDPQRARALLAEAGFPDGRHFPHVHARTYPVDSFATISDWLQAQWRDVLNLDITFQTAEELDVDGVWLWLSGWISSHNRDPGYSL